MYFIIVHSLCNVQEKNSYRDDHVRSQSLPSLSAHIFLCRNSRVGFDKICGGHSRFIILIFIQLVIRIWQLHKHVRRD